MNSQQSIHLLTSKPFHQLPTRPVLQHLTPAVVGWGCQFNIPYLPSPPAHTIPFLHHKPPRIQYDLKQHSATHTSAPNPLPPTRAISPIDVSTYLPSLEPKITKGAHVKNRHAAHRTTQIGMEDMFSRCFDLISVVSTRCL